MERKCLFPVEGRLTLNKWYRIIEETDKEFSVIDDTKVKWSYPKDVFDLGNYRATPSEVKQIKFFSTGPQVKQIKFDFPTMSINDEYQKRLLFETIRNTKPASILLEADKIVNGDRNDQYGDPTIAFEEYASILKTTFGIELTPVEICKVLMAIKLGRLKHKFKKDSIVDLCGYSEILNRLENAK